MVQFSNIYEYFSHFKIIINNHSYIYEYSDDLKNILNFQNHKKRIWKEFSMENICK